MTAPVSRTTTGIDLRKFELQNAVIHNLPDFPANPKKGVQFFHTVLNTMYTYNGTEWDPLDFPWKSAFSNSTPYYKNNVVKYNGALYVALHNNTPVGTLPTDSAYWESMVDGASTVTYSNATPMPVAFGGLAAGHTFSAETVSQVFNEAFYPYQSPAFTSFGITGQPSQIEVGTTLSGSKTFTWTSSNTSNVQAGSVQILQGATVIASGLNATGSTTATITSVTNNAPGSQSWTIRGTNTNNVTFQTTFTVNWYWYRYSGTSTNATLTGAQIQALSTSSLATSGTGNGTYVYGTGGYKYFAYPSTFSTPSANGIKDASNGLPMDMADSTSDPSYSNVGNNWSYALVTVTNSLGVTQSYKVFRTRNILGESYSIVVS